jgi:hypothetical protein
MSRSREGLRSRKERRKERRGVTACHGMKLRVEMGEQVAHRSVHLGGLSHDLPADDLLHESIV